MTTELHILFVCTGNSCRSPMAQGLLNHHASERGLPLRAESAGTRPADAVSPQTVAVMAERGIDLAGHVPTGLTSAHWSRADVVVTLAHFDPAGRPEGFSGERLAWGVDDPFGGSLADYRRARDAIERKVLAWLEGLVEQAGKGGL